MDAKHAEDEQYHEQSETEGAHKLRYRLVGRILRQQSVVEIASRTDVATPETTSPDRGEYRTNHADKCDEAYCGIKPSDDDVGNDNPLEIHTRRCKMAMKVFVFLLHNPYLFLNLMQNYEEYNR